MSATPEYTIFVNSTDSFEDTWEPFFTLFAKYWPNPGRIVLNTETKTYSHPGLDIVCTQVAKPNEKIVPWGTCVKRAMDYIPTELFVYLQDDYFLYDTVDVDAVNRAAELVRDEGVAYIRLRECGGAGPWLDTEYPWLWEVRQDANYRISLQAGMWSKTMMRKYLRSHESPWQMEVLGTKRAHRDAKSRILCVNRDMYPDDEKQVVPYVPTGIMKGKWYRPAVEELFAENGIEMDFSKRGWYEPIVHRRKTFTEKVRIAPKYFWDRLRSW